MDQFPLGWCEVGMLFVDSSQQSGERSHYRRSFLSLQSGVPIMSSPSRNHIQWRLLGSVSFIFNPQQVSWFQRCFHSLKHLCLFREDQARLSEGSRSQPCGSTSSPVEQFLFPNLAPPTSVFVVLHEYQGVLAVRGGPASAQVQFHQSQQAQYVLNGVLICVSPVASQ
ncbi:hypothetical protein NDU88_005726 [Pleurodeles waltl]|uniref:Uncharacterized protein n=1 Tax=Pleurodeles waltl TaxID=8319 RepID=A0AAV7LM02_PLEWA|nr:hypothetical protein NDU88_005726 [Pleurodeles waltl]